MAKSKQFKRGKKDAKKMLSMFSYPLVSAMSKVIDTHCTSSRDVPIDYKDGFASTVTKEADRMLKKAQRKNGSRQPAKV